MLWRSLFSAAFFGWVAICGAAVADAQSGDITSKLGRPGVVVAAPHGTVDTNTDRIATAIAERTGFSLVVATGYSFHRGSRLYRLDVNRPSESLVGGGETASSDESTQIYALYRARVQEAAQGPLALYVEIHGNRRPESAGHVEIATTGVDVDTAIKLRELFSAAQAASGDARALKVLVEPADPVYFRASAAKRHGILTLPTRAIHIELPRAVRMEGDGYAQVLAEFLTRAAPLLLQR
jgi:hypothetical protein